MTDVRAYQPGNTGTLADVVEQGPNLKPLRPAGPDSFAPDPTWSELFKAARPEAMRATPGYDDAKIGEGYAPIVDALGLPASENPGYFAALDPGGQARFGTMGSPSRLATEAQRGERVPFGNQYLADRTVQEGLVLDRIRQRRLKDPNFLSGVPDTPEGLHTYFEQQQAAKRAAGASVLARGSGLKTFTANLAAGGVESALHDPMTLPSLALGGGTASTILQAVGRDALINGVLAATQLPQQAMNMAENDEHLTAGQAVGQIAGAAVFGGLLGGTIHLGATHIPPALFKVMPESVQTRWAGRMRVGENGPLLKDVLGDMDNRELSAFSRATLGDRMTPDEAAAAHVLERSQEVGEASPFMAGPAGDAAHNLNIATSLQALIDGAPHEAPSRGALLASTSLNPLASARPAFALGETRVPSDIVEFFKAKGLDEAHAYGIAAGIVAESGGNHMAVNPKSGAFGLGQLLGSRKAALFDRYGPQPSRVQQLEHLWGELTGGDPGGKFVLEAKDAGSVLDAYVRKFMRPAAGFETDRDLRAGMAALGHKGEHPEGVEPVAGGEGEDPIAALQRNADQAEQEALELASGSEHPDAELGRPAELDTAGVPVLKRELFGSDADWAEAQVAFTEHLRGETSPQSPGNGPPARETGAGPVGEPEAALPPETRGQGIQYHGARGEIPELTEGYYNPDNVYGGHETFYTTDALDIASGYGRRRTSARIYRVDEREPVRMFDMEELVPKAELERMFGISPDDDGLVAVAIDTAAESGRGKLRDVMDEIRAESANEGYTKDDVQELFDAAIHNLRQQGFGGMRHVGGLKTGRAPHNVQIYFDAPGQLDLTDLGGSPVVRIDEPTLKTFDVAGSGRADQVESLEHDLRMEAASHNAAAASAVLDRLTSTGKLPRRPQSLIDFLLKRGGLKDTGGDLRSMGAAKIRGVARRGERKLINPRGLEIDEAFAAAIEAGYFPEFNGLGMPGRRLTYADLPDTDVFLEAIGGELRGEPTYADIDHEAVFERARNAENAAWLGSHVEELHGLADEWGVRVDEGTLEHALNDVAGGADHTEALHNAVVAAALRDLGEAVADTGELRYGRDNEGAPWDPEVNYAEHVEPAADVPTAGRGERRSAPETANAPASRAVAGQPESAAGPHQLRERLYRLDEAGDAKTLSQILDDLDRDRAAVDALRACATPGGAK